MEKRSSVTQGLKGSHKHLIEYLRNNNVSEDVIRELQRSSVDQTKATPEILDIDTLL